MSVRIIVNIIKEGQTATIHDGITSNTAEKIFDGKITKAINVVDSFTFSLYKNNPGYDMLEGMITQVNVTYNGEMIFIGRVLTIKETMDSDGLIKKNVVCEGRLGWLNDTLQPYATYRLTNGIKPALQDIIRIHNLHVDESRQMTIGNVDIEETNEYQYVKNWDTTLETIMDKLHAAGVKVIMQTIPPFDYSGARIDTWNKVNDHIMTSMAERAEGVFDVRTVLSKSADEPYMAKFGGHPNSVGNGIWGKELYDVVKTVAEK